MRRSRGCLFLSLVACAHHTTPAPPAASGLVPRAPELSTSASLPPAARPAKDGDLAALTQIQGEPYLSGELPVAASGPWSSHSAGAVYWVSPTDQVDPARPVGDRWQSGEAVCTVVGYAAVVAEVVDQTPGEYGYVAPNCGSPTVWTRLRCEGETAAFAVPSGVTPPRLAASRPVDPEASARAEAVLRANPRWLADVEEAKRDAELRHIAVDESVAVSAWGLGADALLLVDASVWSGEGVDWCGGEDVLRRVVLVLTDEAQPRVLTDQGLDGRTVLSGLMDISGDGIPELRLGHDGTEVLTGGSSRSLEPVAICIC